MFNFMEIFMCMTALLIPILIYIFYVAYKSNINEEESEIILNFALISSLFLAVSAVNYFGNKSYLLFLSFPIMLAVRYGRLPIILLMSLLCSTFICFSFDISWIYMASLVLILVFPYIYNKRSNTKVTFIPKVFFFSCVLIYSVFKLINYDITYSNLISWSIELLTFAICMITLATLIIKSDDILKFHMTVKDFEHEKNIKDSLFKISHEVKNPIAVIKGYLDMFDSSNKEKTDRYINIIKQEIERTLNLLNDFLLFTKINVEKQPTEFNLLLDDILATLAPIFKKNNITLILKSYDEANINIDFNRMKQVLINLIKNSIESIDKENGEIEIESILELGYLTLIIKDNGCGMDKDTINMLSKPFFTTKETGTGLGVALSNEIILSHGGNLSYTSVIGKGTTTKITLPIK